MNVKELSQWGDVRENEPLKNHTTYKIGGDADYFVEPYDLPSLEALIKQLDHEQIQWMILGNGSNVLIADRPYHGVIISLKKYFQNFHFEGSILTAQAGCSIIGLSHEALNRSLSGLEFASGIPGSLGGGIYMNAGAYRSDLASLIECVTVLRDGKVEVIPFEELDFTYRHSVFQQHRDWIILEARLDLRRGNKQDIQALMDSRKQRRLASQPVSRPSAGSVFRNPTGLNAWKIVDDLGYRGVRVGGARVSEVHSNFIINEGDASAKDVDTLIRQIQKDAKEKMGVDMVIEVERINWEEES